ncbi:PspC domain-containing protein [Microbacteriaceae bacterium VKM Ac-2855]|nr:PspC domain-containing protein [Microbacteriaceae bacterium VKM Ac-2855]
MRTPTMNRPRTRLIGGVCAGLAEHLDRPVSTVRAALLLLTIAGGAGPLFYLWLWATVPAEVGEVQRSLPKDVLVRASTIEPVAESVRQRPITEVLLGLALLAAGVGLVLGQMGVGVSLNFAIPAIVVLAGAGLAWWQFADLRRRGSSSSTVIRVLGALVLVALGIVLFFVTSSRPDVWTVAIASVSVLLGVGIVAAPWAIRFSRDLVEERAAREREAERAEIAAHLHDSVLQTLALIQQKAGPHSEAARLARAQERELRGWLFAGETSVALDLAEELRRIAASIEADYPVQVEVVTAGRADGPSPEPLIAAAREAMLNAARHAGGTVTVYLERGRDAVLVDIGDRGPGIDLDEIPDDRFGVRESIIGRMRRAGGTATLQRGPGGIGTEVRLRMPVESASEPPPAESPADPLPASSNPTSSNPTSSNGAAL